MAKRMREKSEARANSYDNRPHASVKFVRMSASKVKRVLDLIRGEKYENAVAILENLPHEAATVVLKLINSAAANAENNLGLSKKDLVVAECWACPGQTLKRVIYKAKGSASGMLKRTSHIYCVLENEKVK